MRGELGMSTQELCWPKLLATPGANYSSSKRVWRRTLGHCRAFCRWWHGNSAALRSSNVPWDFGGWMKGCCLVWQWHAMFENKKHPKLIWNPSHQLHFSSFLECNASLFSCQFHILHFTKILNRNMFRSLLLNFWFNITLFFNQTITAYSTPGGRVAVAGLAPGYTASEPLLVVASAGDGVVPLRRVEQALPAQTMLQVGCRVKWCWFLVVILIWRWWSASFGWGDSC